MRIAYIRTSTEHQSYQRQVEILKPYNIEKYFEEQISGKNMDRPKLQEMLDFVRSGDQLYVAEFSRLARSLQDLLTIVATLEKKGVSLISCKEKIDGGTASGKLMLSMVGAISEFERMVIVDRVRAGVAIAKAAGKYKGRKPVSIKDFGSYYDRYLRREFTKTSLAAELHISRQTLYRIIKEYENSPEYKEKYPSRILADENAVPAR